MKSILKFIVFISLSLVSCSKDDNAIIEPAAVEDVPSTAEEAGEVDEEIMTPILGVISPLNGPKATIVAINGANFGADATQVKVLFNETEAEIIQLADNEIKVTVPAGAYSGLIKIVVRNLELTGPEFTYQITENVVTTLAGSIEGFSDGEGTDAKFNRPTGLAVDSNGNTFVADPLNNRIRKITPDGTVRTFAGGTKGSENGLGTEAQFDAPWDVDVDAQGNVYVADSNNHRIRKISPEGEVTTLAGSIAGNVDGQGTDAQFEKPLGISVTPDGVVYFTNSINATISRIDQARNVTTFSAGFGTVRGIAVDQDENVYFVEPNSHQIWKINFENNFATLIVADAKPDTEENFDPTRLKYPRDIEVDFEGNLFVADEGNHMIRKITPDGQIVTYAGSVEGSEDGVGENAQFNFPYGLAIDTKGIVYIADTSNNRIRKITQE